MEKQIQQKMKPDKYPKKSKLKMESKSAFENLLSVRARV